MVFHSFNGGNSFTIWSGTPGVKWWDELFDGSVAWAVLIRFAVLFVVSVILRNVLMRTTKISRRLLNWSGPAAFLLAFVINGMSTDWYETVFDFASIGDAIRNSFIAAFGATILAVILGGFAGIALARRPGVWTKVFMATVFLILVTPEIMDAIVVAIQRKGVPRIDDKADG